MSNIDKFIANKVIDRSSSMFEEDIRVIADRLSKENVGQSICVFGGAGSIGSSFIKAVDRFHPGKHVVIDLNEKGLFG